MPGMREGTGTEDEQEKEEILWLQRISGLQVRDFHATGT